MTLTKWLQLDSRYDLARKKRHFGFRDDLLIFKRALVGVENVFNKSCERVQT